MVQLQLVTVAQLQQATVNSMNGIDHIPHF